MQGILDLLKPHALMPALKSVMATIHHDTGWLRVRPPLVAMSAEAHARFSATIEAFAIDTARE